MWSFRSSRERRTEGAYNILLLGTHALSLRSPVSHLVRLGPRESGKSTIMKRMCITYQGGFCHDARMLYREAIYSNLLESAQAVAAALRKFGVEPTDPSNLVSSPDHDSLTLYSTSFRVANVGKLVGTRYTAGVADMSISLYLLESDRRSHTQSLARPNRT